MLLPLLLLLALLLLLLLLLAVVRRWEEVPLRVASAFVVLALFVVCLNEEVSCSVPPYPSASSEDRRPPPVIFNDTEGRTVLTLLPCGTTAAVAFGRRTMFAVAAADESARPPKGAEAAAGEREKGGAKADCAKYDVYWPATAAATVAEAADTEALLATPPPSASSAIGAPSTDAAVAAAEATPVGTEGP